MRNEVTSIYELFVDRVASGRSLDRAAVDAVAQGRVWTGAQAAERNLVDALGGLREASRRAKLALELDPDADVALVVYPPPKTLVEQVSELLHGARAQLAPEVPHLDVARRFEPWLRAAAEGGPAALLPFAIDVH
jgi:ClpP class serine protease